MLLGNPLINFGSFFLKLNFYTFLWSEKLSVFPLYFFGFFFNLLWIVLNRIFDYKPMLVTNIAENYPYHPESFSFVALKIPRLLMTSLCLRGNIFQKWILIFGIEKLFKWNHRWKKQSGSVLLHECFIGDILVQSEKESKRLFLNWAYNRPIDWYTIVLQIIFLKVYVHC